MFSEQVESPNDTRTAMHDQVESLKAEVEGLPADSLVSRLFILERDFCYLLGAGDEF